MLHQVSSDLGEVNSFYNSFSDPGQKATPAFQKLKKTLPGKGLIFKPELLFFYLNFYGCILNICLIKVQKANLSM